MLPPPPGLIAAPTTSTPSQSTDGIKERTRAEVKILDVSDIQPTPPVITMEEKACADQAKAEAMDIAKRLAEANKNLEREGKSGKTARTGQASKWNCSKVLEKSGVNTKLQGTFPHQRFRHNLSNKIYKSGGKFI